MFLVLTGESWPEADEDGLRRLAAAWSEFVADLDGIEAQVDAARHAGGAGWLGQGADAFNQTMTELASSGAVGQLRSGAQKLSSYASDSALNVEYTKYSIIGQLVILAAQIAAMVPLLFFPPTAPAAAGWMAAAQAMGRFMAATLFRRLVTSLAVNLLLQVGLDVIIQAIQFGRGDRTEWDTRRTGGAALSGVIGAVFGEVLGQVGARLIGRAAMQTLAAQAARGALHEWGTEAIADMIFNGRREAPSGWSASAGAVEGALDWAGGRSRGAFAGAPLPGDLDIAPIGVPGLSFSEPLTGGRPIGPFTMPGAMTGDMVLTGTFTDRRDFAGIGTITGTFAPASGGAPITGTFSGQISVRGGAAVSSTTAPTTFTAVGQPGAAFGQLRTTGTLTGEFTLEGSFQAAPAQSSPPAFTELPSDNSRAFATTTAANTGASTTAPSSTATTNSPLSTAAIPVVDAGGTPVDHVGIHSDPSRFGVEIVRPTTADSSSTLVDSDTARTIVRPETPSTIVTIGTTNDITSHPVANQVVPSINIADPDLSSLTDVHAAKPWQSEQRPHTDQPSQANSIDAILQDGGHRMTNPSVLPIPAPLQLTAADLAARATATTAVTQPTVDNCLALLRTLGRQLYPHGIVNARASDDLSIGTARDPLNTATDSNWPRVDSWHELEQAVRIAGPGATAFVLMRRPGQIGHAFALHHTTDLGPRYVDLAAGESQLESAVDTRALLVDAAGHVVTDPFTPALESHSIARAVIDAPDSQYGVSLRDLSRKIRDMLAGRRHPAPEALNEGTQASFQLPPVPITEDGAWSEDVLRALDNPPSTAPAVEETPFDHLRARLRLTSEDVAALRRLAQLEDTDLSNDGAVEAASVHYQLSQLDVPEGRAVSIADLRRVLDLAAPAAGAPRMLADLIDLVRHTVDPAAVQVSPRHVADLVDGIRAVAGAGVVTAAALATHFTTAARKGSGADGTADRSRELNWLRTVVAPRSADSLQPTAREGALWNSLDRKTQERALRELIGLRRDALDPRSRRFDALASYGPFVRRLLGRNDTNQETMLSLLEATALALRARPLDRLGFAPLTMTELARAVIQRDWPTGAPPESPASTEDDFNAAVPGLQYLANLSDPSGLTGWLNRLLPATTNPLHEADVIGALTMSMTAALDEGLRLDVSAAGLDYRITLRPHVVGPPVANMSAPVVDAKLEQRVNSIEVEHQRGRGTTRAGGIDVGAVARFGEGVTFSLRGSIGGQHATVAGESSSVATGRYMYLKPDDKVGQLDVPVTWSAVVTERSTGRSRQATWTDDTNGGERRERMMLHVPLHLMPANHTEPSTRRLTSPDELPLWRMHHGVERVFVADRLRQELRRQLGDADYLRWQSEVELFLSNDRIGSYLADAHRPSPTYQQIPRLTLRRDGDSLSLSLRATPNRITDLGVPTAKVKYDQLSQLLTKESVATEKRLGGRGGISGVLRIFGIGHIGGGYNGTRTGGISISRGQTAWLMRAMRAQDANQVVILASDYELRVDRGSDGHETPSQPIRVEGWAHVRVRTDELTAAQLAQPDGRTLSAHPPTDMHSDEPSAQAPDAARWWNPYAPARDHRDRHDAFGIGFGAVDAWDPSVIERAYDDLAATLVERGYLPAAANPDGQTPWQALQSMADGGIDLNKPGVRFANWRTLVDGISESMLTRAVDDVMAEGIVLDFVSPTAMGEPMSVQIRAIAIGTGTVVGSSPMMPVNTFVGLDGTAIRHATSTGHEGYLQGTMALRVGLGFGGARGARTTDRSGPSVSSTMMTYARTEGSTSLYEVPVELQWTWAADAASRGQTEGFVRTWQPDSLADQQGAGPPPRLIDDGQLSVLRAVTARAPISVAGVPELLHELGQRLGRSAPIGITTSRYKANLPQLFSAGLRVTVGSDSGWLRAQPIGRPQLLKRVKVYTEVMQESQAGRERETDTLTSTETRGTGGYRPGLPGDSGAATLGRRTGDGAARSSGRTGGSYRSLTGTADMYVVRTAVRNDVLLHSGGTVIVPGEVIMFVAAHQIERANARLFDDPYRLLPRQAAAPAIDPDFHPPPPSLRDGRLWTAVWEEGIGPRVLHQRIEEAALELGGPALTIGLMPLLSGLANNLPQLVEGPQSWRVRANGRRYKLTISAQRRGDPSYQGDDPAAVLKLYTRANDSAGDKTRHQRATPIGLSGGGRAGDSSSGDAYANVSFGVSGTRTTEDVDMTGTNLLTMDGERPKGVARFTQDVELRFTLKEMIGSDLATSIRPTRAVTREAILERYTGHVPIDGSLPSHLVTRFSVDVPINALPGDVIIHGVDGLAAIESAAHRHGGRHVSIGTVRPGERLLTRESLIADFGSLLTTDGMRYEAIAGGAKETALPAGMTLRAELGPTLEMYHVRSAELEHYDHITRSVADQQSVSTTIAGGAAVTVPIPVAPGVVVGPRQDVGMHHTTADTATVGRSTEHRSWLRRMGESFHMYAPVTFTVTVGQGAARVNGAIEFVVTADGATALGVPPDLLAKARDISAALNDERSQPPPNETVNPNEQSTTELDESRTQPRGSEDSGLSPHNETPPNDPQHSPNALEAISEDHVDDGLALPDPTVARDSPSRKPSIAEVLETSSRIRQPVDSSVVRDRLLLEYRDGFRDLMDAAGRIVLRETFHLAGNQTLPDSANARSFINNALGELPLLQVADALRVDYEAAIRQARQITSRYRSNVQDPPPQRTRDLNELSTAQRRVAEELGRYARWTRPDGDCWFDSLIRAARDIPNPPAAIADIAGMTTLQLRERLVDLLLVDTTLLADLGAMGSDLDGFVNQLSQARKWTHEYFDMFLGRAPGLLGVRVEIVRPGGEILHLGRDGGPILYLAHTTNHYMPLVTAASAELPRPPTGHPFEDAASDESRLAPVHHLLPDSTHWRDTSDGTASADTGAVSTEVASVDDDAPPTDPVRRWLAPRGADRELLLATRTRGNGGYRPEWAGLTETQTWALLSAELRGVENHEGNRQAFVARLASFNVDYGTSYPVEDDKRLTSILDAAHEHLRTLPIARNWNLGGVLTVDGHSMTSIEHLTSQHRFPTYWETDVTFGTPFRAGRGYIEERQGYGPVLNRTGGDPYAGIGDGHSFAPTSPTETPLYASLVSEQQRGGTYGYGNTVVYFGDHVRVRSTHTPGDSSKFIENYTDNRHVFGLLAYGNPVNVRFIVGEATRFAYDRTIRSDTMVPGYAALGRYIETQIHGTLTWSDVSRVVVNWGDLHGSLNLFVTKDQAEGIVKFLLQFLDGSEKTDPPGYNFTVELGQEIGRSGSLAEAAQNRAYGLFDELVNWGPEEAALVAELDGLAFPGTPFPVAVPRYALIDLARNVGVNDDDGAAMLDELWRLAIRARSAYPGAALTLEALTTVGREDSEHQRATAVSTVDVTAWAVLSADPVALAILGDLRDSASPVDGLPDAGLLGPDIFDLRRPPNPPMFLDAVNQDAVGSNQLHGFFDRLNLALSTMPTLASRDTLAADDSTLVQLRPGSRSWATDPQLLPEDARFLPATIEFPRLVHTIWFGRPLVDDDAATAVVRRNLAELAHRTTAMVVLWTDITRSEFQRAAGAAHSTDDAWLRGVREMLDWARENAIRLINVDEVFHAEAPLALDQPYRMELAKRHGHGYAAASDIVRLAVMERFGGLYTDGDNVVSDDLDELWEDDELPQSGLRVHNKGREVYANSAFFAARAHPFFRQYQRRIADNYERTQLQLLGADRPADQTREGNREWAVFLSRRNSVLRRTGPENLRSIRTWGGHRVRGQLRGLGQTPLRMESNRSWQQVSPLAPASYYSPEEVGAVTRAITATLIRELYNREGDLHLTYVEPLLAGLPNRDGALRAIVRFLLEDPTLRGRIRTVTDRVLDADGPDHVVVLPDDVRTALGLALTVEGQDPDGVWRLGELMRPVRLALTGREPHPE